MNKTAIKDLVLTLIPEFRLRKKLLDMSTGIILDDLPIRLSPLRTSNFILVDTNKREYLNDKMSSLVNTMLRDSSLVISNITKSVTTRYKIKYNDCKLSVSFSSGLELQVTINSKIPKEVSDSLTYMEYKSSISKKDMEAYTEHIVLYYVSSGLLNIPKYEYPLAIVCSNTNISMININGDEVAYTHSGECSMPKLLRIRTDEFNNFIDGLKVLGDIISAKPFNYNLCTRILSIINYATYFDNISIDIDLIKSIIKTMYAGKGMPRDNVLLALIDYVKLLDIIISFRSKTNKTTKRKNIVI